MIPIISKTIQERVISPKNPVQSADATAQDQNIKLQPNTPGRLETAAAIGFILTAPVSVPLALAFGAGFYGTKGLIALGSLLSNQLSKLLSPPAQSQKNLEKELVIVALVEVFPSVLGDGTSSSNLNETIAKTTEASQETVEVLTEEHSNETEAESGLPSGEFQGNSTINVTEESGAETLEEIEENQKTGSEEKRTEGFVELTVIQKLINKELGELENITNVVAAKELLEENLPIDLEKEIQKAEKEGKLNKENRFQILVAGGKEYVISILGEQKEILSKVKEVGTGSFSKVSELQPIQGNGEIQGTSKWVAKGTIGTGLNLEKSKKDIKTDFEIAKLLNKDYHLVEYESSLIVIMPNYPIGGKDIIKRDQKNKVANSGQISSVVSQVTKGLEDMQKKGVFLRDIKTENFRAKENEKGEMEVVFTDFGGTVLLNFDQIKKDVEKGDYISSSVAAIFKANVFGIAVTPEYIPIEVYRTLVLGEFPKFIRKFDETSDAIGMLDKSNTTLNELKDTEAKILNDMEAIWAPEMKRWGQYATGISLYEMITGEQFGKGNDWANLAKLLGNNDRGYFEFTDKKGAHEHMDKKLLAAGANEADRKKIIDLVFPPPVPTEGTV